MHQKRRRIKDQIIELAPGDSYFRCSFYRCYFVGCGMAKFSYCHFQDCNLPKERPDDIPVPIHLSYCTYAFTA